MAAKKTVKKKAPKFKVVKAVEAFEIYADYDANAPDTKGYVVVVDETVAKGLCDILNRDPSDVKVAHVDGYEWSKSFQYRSTLVELEYAENCDYKNPEEAFKAFCNICDYWPSDDDSDDQSEAVG